MICSMYRCFASHASRLLVSQNCFAAAARRWLSANCARAAALCDSMRPAFAISRIRSCAGFSVARFAVVLVAWRCRASNPAHRLRPRRAHDRRPRALGLPFSTLCQRGRAGPLSVDAIDAGPESLSRPFGKRRDGVSPCGCSFGEPCGKFGHQAAVPVALLEKPCSAQRLPAEPVQVRTHQPGGGQSCAFNRGHLSSVAFKSPNCPAGASLIHSEQSVYAEYPDPRRCEWQTKILPALRKPFEDLLKLSGISRSAVFEILAGRSMLQRKSLQMVMQVAAEAWVI